MVQLRGLLTPIIRFQRCLFDRQDDSLFAAFILLLGQESRSCCVLEDFPNALVRLCRAFEVVSCANLLLDLLALLKNVSVDALPAKLRHNGAKQTDAMRCCAMNCATCTKY